ncbi:MAG: hypothetical protein JWP97_975 [Labilithrix sp.]|nr:hypothetical protein [Labilithrix sp.]
MVTLLLLRFAPLAVVLAALGTAFAVVACSAEEVTPGDVAQQGTQRPDDTTTGGGTPKPLSDGGTASSGRYRGNPLCNTAQADSCMPDDDAHERSASSKECAAQASPDAGAGTDGEDAHSCRLTHGDDGGVAPQCFGESAAAGTNGATCDRGSDCAPGYDCVAGEKGNKSCRHYCCTGTCSGTLANGSATFCDVQSLVDLNAKAPVCMPVKRCSTLLGKGECAASETCTVVTESGDTGCVAVGDRQVGDSCDESHCAADLACLGQPGARKCFKLCKVSASDCPSPQTCVPSAAFKDGAFGICASN